MSAIVVVVPVIPIVHGPVSPAAYRAIVWTLSITAALVLAIVAVWGYLGFTDWLRRRR